MPSQTVCYPAKLAHGHIASLLRKGLKRIFFPCLPRERRENKNAADGYNCPVVAGYPEVIRLNTDELLEQDCTLYTPFVSLEHPDTLVAVLHDLFGIPKGTPRSRTRRRPRTGSLPHRAPGRRRTGACRARTHRQARHRTVRTALPCRSGGPSRSARTRRLPRRRRAQRGQCGAPRASRRTAPGRGPVDLSFPSVSGPPRWYARAPTSSWCSSTSFGCGLDAITAD